MPVVIADLPGSELGQLSSGTITIDQNAVGYGWVVDSTPKQDHGFLAHPGTAELQAVDPQATAHVDLLMAVEQELAQWVGLSDLDASTTSLMNGQLPTGIRRDVAPSDVDAVFSCAVSFR